MNEWINEWMNEWTSKAKLWEIMVPVQTLPLTDFGRNWQKVIKQMKGWMNQLSTDFFFFFKFCAAHCYIRFSLLIASGNNSDSDTCIFFLSFIVFSWWSVIIIIGHIKERGNLFSLVIENKILLQLQGLWFLLSINQLLLLSVFHLYHFSCCRFCLIFLFIN
jgi:hypothetical protein